MSRSRIPELDLLRFSAAAAVVVFHFYVLLPGDTGLQRAIAAVGRFGFMGVPLFFMISGFVILWTAFNKSPGQFVLARLCRLYPSYWICVLITSGVLIWAGGAVSWGRIAANLTMAQHLFGFKSIDPVYWTLFVELKFYGLVFILLLCRQLPRVERWLGFWLGLSAVSLLAWAVGHGVVPGLDTVVFEGSAAYFACGCYAYLIRTRGGSLGRWIGFWAGAVLSLFAVFRSQYHYTQADDWGTLAAVAGMMGVAQGLLIGIALDKWRVPEWRGWYWLGSLTYPLYLLHAEGGKEFFRKLPGGWGVWTRMAVALGVVLAVTTLVAVLVEQRGCNALYRVLSGMVGWRRASAAEADAALVGKAP